MTEREALKLALEALKRATNYDPVIARAITAIKEALAQPEQKPVAWVSSEELLVMRGNALGGAKDWRINVGLVKQDGDVGLYTTPPQRKPLTDEEIGAILEGVNAYGTRLYTFARAIEAAHGIKEIPK